MSPKLYPNLYEKLKDKAVITTNDTLSVTEDKYQTSQELTRLSKGGYLQKIRRGLYALVPIEFIGKDYQPDKFLVASRVSEPYAISHYSALELHGIGQSVFNRVYISSPNRIIHFSHQGIEYKGVITRDLFGSTTIVREGQVINVTDIERTILDCLRQPDLAGGVDEFIRSLEGVQATDILAILYKEIIAHNKFPKIITFRAKYDNRRQEIDDLSVNKIFIIRRILLHGESYLLSLAGLFYCPLPEAQNDIEQTKNIFQYLRTEYRNNPEQLISGEQISRVLNIEQNQVKRILTVLTSTDIFSRMDSDKDGFVFAITLIERILDYKDFDDLLSRFATKKESSFNKTSLDYQRFLEYLQKVNDKSLYAKAGFLLRLFETSWKVEPEVFDSIKKHISRAKYYWPSKLARGTGEQIKEWNLIVPEYLVNKYQYATRQKIS